MNTTLDDLKNISITAKKEALKSWFSKVVRNLEEVKLKKYVSRQTSDSAYFEEVPQEVFQILKFGLQGSLLSKFFVKPNKVIVKRLDLEELERIQFMDEVEAGLIEQKLTTETMKAQLMEVCKNRNVRVKFKLN